MTRPATPRHRLNVRSLRHALARYKLILICIKRIVSAFSTLRLFTAPALRLPANPRAAKQKSISSHEVLLARAV